MRFGYTLTLFSALCATSANADSSFPPKDIGSTLTGLVGSVRDVLSSSNHLEKLWEETQKRGPQAAQVVLDEVTKLLPQATRAIEEFKDAMTQVVEQAQKIHTEIHNAVEGKGITAEHVADLLSREIGQVCRGLEDEVNDPLPEDRGERARGRARLIRQVMEKVGVAYIHVLTEKGVPREQAETQFKDFSAKLIHLLLVVGNIIDRYPILLEGIVFAASIFLPTIPILRPILTLFGFGPLGPIKGSAAAWAQRTFWGKAVARGSWFAILQRVGMTMTGSWVDKLIASTGLAAALGFAAERQREL